MSRNLAWDWAQRRQVLWYQWLRHHERLRGRAFLTHHEVPRLLAAAERHVLLERRPDAPADTSTPAPGQVIRSLDPGNERPFEREAWRLRRRMALMEEVFLARGWDWAAVMRETQVLEVQVRLQGR